jgi:hypothetical protein
MERCRNRLQYAQRQVDDYANTELELAALIRPASGPDKERYDEVYGERTRSWKTMFHLKKKHWSTLN